MAWYHWIEPIPDRPEARANTATGARMKDEIGADLSAFRFILNINLQLKPPFQHQPYTSTFSFNMPVLRGPSPSSCLALKFYKISGLIVLVN